MISRLSRRTSALLLALVLVVSGCSAPSRHDRSVQVGGVTVSGSALPDRLQVTTAAGAPRIAHTTVLSDTFAMTPSGPLPAGLSVKIPVRGTVATGVGVAVATSESLDGPWQLLAGTLSEDRRTVRFTTSHFSFFSALGVDLKDLFSQFRQEFVDPISGSVLADAQRPACGDEAGARTDGYSITSDSGSTVYWCLGRSAGGRFLTVVNNRRYPLQVSRGGLPVTRAADGPGWQKLSGHAPGSPVVIPPRLSTTFAVNLAPGAKATLETSFDSFDQSLVQLYVGIDALVSILTRFGKGGATKVVQAMDTVLQSQKCYDALGQGPVPLLANCFSPEDLWKALGGWAFLVIPLMVFGPFIEYFRSEFNAIGDQLNGRDRYRIVVSRASTVEAAPGGHRDGGTNNAGPGAGNPAAGGNAAPPPPPAPATRTEVTGGVTHTWSNYTNAGGTPGPTIPAYTGIQISCRLTGFKVANGNPWWYRIAAPGWDNNFYASADAFYNNGQTSGSLVGTPWIDDGVPTC